jgi:hypothetical protein
VPGSGFFVREHFIDTDIGFKAIAYKNDAKEIIIAFAGTDGPDAVDWRENLFYQGANQFRKAYGEVSDWLSRNTNDQTTIHFTGQSLGGALAELAAYQYSSPLAAKRQVKGAKLAYSSDSLPWPSNTAAGALIVQPRPATWSRFASNPGHLLDAGQEALVAQRLALVEREPDVVDDLLVQVSAEQGSVGRLALPCGGAEGKVERVWREARVGLSKRIGAVARPAVVRRVVHHRRTHGVELDVALGGEQVGLRLYQ